MNKQDIIELIVSNIYEVIPELEGQEFGLDDKLVDLGANSVDRAEIITRVKEVLSLKIPPSELYGAKSIGELANVFYAKL
ncbi:acyl carrier protein [Syntrophomonas curvata]